MITSLRLQNFRSYGDQSFEFDKGVNIVVGPNASGKTNLLEAIVVLARGASYRARDSELVKIDRPWARLDGVFEKQPRTLKIEAQDDSAVKSFELDSKPFRRLSLERTVPVVLFEPNHLQLITLGPQARRDYFDDLLEQTRPYFKSLAAAYRRALAQRNSLLKHHRKQALQQLFAWNIRLSELGAQIALARQELADQINKDISKNYSRIAKKRSKAALEYASQFPASAYASRMLSKLEKTTDLDFERGFTGSGPHREDFVFYLGGRPAGATASRGEARSLLLALKVFELRLVEEARGRTPIFLLDDVFSELDAGRRRALVDGLSGRQATITTTDAEAVIEHFSDNQSLIALP